MSDAGPPTIAGELLFRRSSRRDFIRLTVAAGAALYLPALASCARDPVRPEDPVAIDLGTDVGALNFAYALEQLEVDFFRRVIDNRFAGMTAMELATLSDIANHEVAHRNVLYGTITTSRISDLLLFDFRTLDFSSRASVMPYAQRLQDLIAAAYTGLARLLTDLDAVGLAAKFASVEARHAAALRDLADVASGSARSGPRTQFAGDDVVDRASGLEVVRSPADVLAALSPYYKTRLTLTGGRA